MEHAAHPESVSASRSALDDNAEVEESEHPLALVLDAAARGVFPPEGPVSFVPAPRDLAAAVVALSGHTYVAANLDEAEIRGQFVENLYLAAVLPAFIEWLGKRVGGCPKNTDVVLAAMGTGDPSPALIADPNWRTHERARHGARLRRDVTGWTSEDGSGTLLLGRGLVDRWEVAYEVGPEAPRGSGRILAESARGLMPSGEPVFAQVAPGHARSLRATLAAGYRPIGSEILIPSLTSTTA